MSRSPPSAHSNVPEHSIPSHQQDDIYEKLTEQSYNYYCKANSYRQDNELEGALINYLLALNNLNNVRDYIIKHNMEYGKYIKSGKVKYETELLTHSSKDKKQVCHPEDIQNDINTAIQKILGHIRPLQEQLKRVKTQRGTSSSGTSGAKDDKEEISCTDIKAEAQTTETFDDVSGQEVAKQQLRDSILNPLLYPRLYPNLSKGILFYGPPGTGKTLMGKAFSNELQIAADKSGTDVRILFYTPKGSDLKGKYLGESEKKIAAYFKCASQAASDCKSKLFNKNTEQKSDKKESQVISVLFIDEIEAIAGNRDNDESGIMTTTVNALLQEMDGVNSYSNVIVMGATNYPWKLDEAILRRFDTKIYIKLPSAQDIATQIKTEIVNKYIKKALDNPRNIKESDAEIKLRLEAERQASMGAKSGDLKCGPDDKITLKKFTFENKLKPWEVFDFYRDNYFSKFTDDDISNFAKLLEKALFSGGDVKNVCMRVFKSLGKDANEVGTFIDQFMFDPKKVAKLLANENNMNLFKSISQNDQAEREKLEKELLIKNNCEENKTENFVFKYFDVNNGSSDELIETKYPKVVVLMNTIPNTKPDNKYQQPTAELTQQLSSKSASSLIFNYTVEDIYLGNTIKDNENFKFLYETVTKDYINDIYIPIQFIPKIIDKLVYTHINYVLPFDTFITKLGVAKRDQKIEESKFKYLNTITSEEYSNFIKNNLLNIYNSVSDVLKLAKNDTHEVIYLSLDFLLRNSIQYNIMNTAPGFVMEKFEVRLLIKQNLIIPASISSLQIKKDVWFITHLTTKVNTDNLMKIKKGATWLVQGTKYLASSTYQWASSFFRSKNDSKLKEIKKYDKTAANNVNFDELKEASNYLMAEIYSNMRSIICVEYEFTINESKVYAISNIIPHKIKSINTTWQSGSSINCLARGVLFDEKDACGQLVEVLDSVIDTYNRENESHSMNSNAPYDKNTEPILYNIEHNSLTLNKLFAFTYLGKNKWYTDYFDRNLFTVSSPSQEKHIDANKKLIEKNKTERDAIKAAEKAAKAAAEVEAAAKAAVDDEDDIYGGYQSGGDVYGSEVEDVQIIRPVYNAMYFIHEDSKEDKIIKKIKSATEYAERHKGAGWKKLVTTPANILKFDTGIKGVKYYLELENSNKIKSYYALYALKNNYKFLLDPSGDELPIPLNSYNKETDINYILYNENNKLNAEQIKQLTEKLKQKACVETASELKSERENGKDVILCCDEETDESRRISLAFDLTYFNEAINVKNLDSIKATVKQDKVDMLDAYSEGRYDPKKDDPKKKS